MSFDTRLTAHFDSNYRKLQEEISLFIKGFPIITLEDVSSINELVALTVKQNSLLAQRFREQIVQIKENYRRSEQYSSELSKKNTELQKNNSTLQLKIDDLNKQLNRANHELEIKTEVLEQYERERSQIEQDRKIAKDIHSNLREIRHKMMLTFNELLENRLPKTYDIFVEKLTLLRDTFSAVSVTDSNNIAKEFENFKLMFVEKMKLDRSKYRAEKQKTGQLRNVLETITFDLIQFVHKAKEVSKLYRLIDKNPATEKYLEGIETEMEALEDRVKEYRSKGINGRKQTQGEQPFSAEKGIFHSLLKEVADMIERTSEASSSRDHLADELEKFRSMSRDAESRHKQDIQELEKFFNGEIQKLREQLTLKDELTRFYEQNVMTAQKNLQELEKSHQELLEDLKETETILRDKCNSLESLLEQYEFLQEKNQKAEQNIVVLENEKDSMQARMAKEVEILQRKVETLEEELKVADEAQHELQTTFKQEINLIKDDAEKTKQQLLKQVEEEKRLKDQLGASLVTLQKNYGQEQMILTERSHQMNEYERQQTQLQQQKQALEQLIRELQLKLRSQSAELRDKNSQILQAENKIRKLLADNQQNLESLKMIQKELPDLSRLKFESEQLQQQNGKLVEQNNNLKSLLKMAKQDISESRAKLADYLTLEHQRETYKMRAETLSVQLEETVSELRNLDEQLKKQKTILEQNGSELQELEKVRLQRLCLQGENSRLSLELKHAHVLLHKIDELRDVVK